MTRTCRRARLWTPRTRERRLAAPVPRLTVRAQQALVPRGALREPPQPCVFQRRVYRRARRALEAVRDAREGAVALDAPRDLGGVGEEQVAVERVAGEVGREVAQPRDALRVCACRRVRAPSSNLSKLQNFNENTVAATMPVSLDSRARKQSRQVSHASALHTAALYCTCHRNSCRRVDIATKHCSRRRQAHLCIVSLTSDA